MRFKKPALALFACLALGTFTATAASAAEGDGWTIEGSGAIPTGTHQGVSCAKHTGSSLVLTSTLLGLEVELSAEGVDCFEKAGSANAATIDNTTSKGHSEGILTFTNVKVLKPSKCTMGNVGKSGAQEVTTEKFTGQVIMGERIDELSGGVKIRTIVVVDKFSPEETGGAFATIEFGGAECPLSEASAPVKGTACGESPNNTGFLTAFQTLIFGTTQQTAGGCALTLGTKAAVLSGSIDNMLAGTNFNKWFGAD